ncbi:MAG: hypothetical protein AAGE98_08650, partial [Actinomycetota bacterium]
MKKLFLILLACVLFAVACGDDDPVETSDASDSASASESESASASSAMSSSAGSDADADADSDAEDESDASPVSTGSSSPQAAANSTHASRIRNSFFMTSSAGITRIRFGRVVDG